MDGNILEDGERRSLDDMISEDIKFITGKEKFDYVLAVSFPGDNLSINIMTNIPPANGLKGFLSILYKSIISVPDNELKNNTGIKKVIIKEDQKDGE